MSRIKTLFGFVICFVHVTEDHRMWSLEHRKTWIWYFRKQKTGDFRVTRWWSRGLSTVWQVGFSSLFHMTEVGAEMASGSSIAYSVPQSLRTEASEDMIGLAFKTSQVGGQLFLVNNEMDSAHISLALNDAGNFRPCLVCVCWYQSCQPVQFISWSKCNRMIFLGTMCIFQKIYANCGANHAHTCK